MWPGVTNLPAEWEDQIEAFEAACAGHGRPELADFLPADGHPLRLAVLAELVRIDMEYSWKRGAAKRLEVYRPAFPELFSDPGALRGVAFEEYRLRRLAGEEPTPTEYEKRIGMAIGFWPRPRTPRAAAPVGGRS
jgi:hypothetical protein